jgi:hypothetical protein
VYPLLHNPLMNAVVRRLKSETGMDVVVLNPSARCYVNGDVVIRDAGPLEFLSLFANARRILTTTFHGVCFAVIFEKEFHTFLTMKGEIRITSLLDILGLSDRILADANMPVSGTIPYDRVNRVIESERKRASEYLAETLGL